MFKDTGYLLLLLILTLFAVFYGKILFLLSGNPTLKKLTRHIMRYSTLQYEQIRASLLGLFYYVTPAAFIAVLCIVYQFNIFQYFLMDVRYLPYLLIGILAELSVTAMLSGLFGIFSPKTDWVKEISSIPWIDSIKDRPPALAPLVPLLGSFFEECYFRGVVFLMVCIQYPQYGWLAPFILSAVLFSLQQMLYTNNSKQAFSMLLGSVGVSCVGCMLIMLTGSLLPALVAHQSFVLLYFQRFSFSS
jgi:hypothetical protein